MKTQNLTHFIKVIQKGLIDHSPEILTALGITGMASSMFMVAKATPKALKKIEEAEKEKHNDFNPDEFSVGKEPLTRMETVKAVWKTYAPAAITFTTSTACIVGAHSINARRNAALVTACQLSTTALNEYKEAAVEIVGEEKAKEIRDKVIEERKERSKINDDTIASPSSYSIDEDVLIREPVSGQYFWSTEEKVKGIQNELNGRMIDGREYSISLNELLAELGLKRHILGDDIGWNVDRRIDLYCCDSHTDNKKPCFEIAYLTPPEHEYRDYYR